MPIDHHYHRAAACTSCNPLTATQGLIQPCIWCDQPLHDFVRCEDLHVIYPDGRVVRYLERNVDNRYWSNLVCRWCALEPAG